MVKSKPKPIRFSNEELEKIYGFMNKHKIKSFNDFVRKSVGITIGVFEWAGSPEAVQVYKDMEKFNRSFTEELSKVPSTKSKLKAKWAFFNQGIIPKLEKSMDVSRKKSKPFAKKRKAGRPKRKKRKTPGRPKESGYVK